MARTVTEYRLLIERRGNGVKDWRARSMKAVRRRLGLLTSPEPWRFYGDGEYADKGPDDYVCCAGTYHDQCGCGGLTMREDSELKRRDLPPIESLRLQKRQVFSSDWESIELPESVDAVDPQGEDSTGRPRVLNLYAAEAPKEQN